MKFFPHAIAPGLGVRRDPIRLLPMLLLLPIAELPAQDFTYTNNNGAITITGYNGPGGNVTIPSTIDGLPVIRIGGHAFFDAYSVASVIIPDTVTNLDDGVWSKGGGVGPFWNCTALTNVTFGTGVAHIGLGAFGFCTSLPRVSIPDSVTSLGDFAFRSRDSLTAVTLGKNLTSVGTGIGYAFAWCSNLVSFYFKGNPPSFLNNFTMVEAMTVIICPEPPDGGRPSTASPRRCGTPPCKRPMAASACVRTASALISPAQQTSHSSSRRPPTSRLSPGFPCKAALSPTA